MKCDICGERPAVIFVQQVTKESSMELHLCEKCAKERGFSTSESKVDISLGNIFSGILENPESGGGKENACPGCGFTLADIRKLRKVGCADCYSHFRGEIISILRSEGVDLSYTGHLPERLETFRPSGVDPENLRKELQSAIEKEDYELAAYYRDRLKTLGERK